MHLLLSFAITQSENQPLYFPFPISNVTSAVIDGSFCLSIFTLLAFLLDNRDSYSHCNHRDELHKLARYRHKSDRDDVYRFGKDVEFRSCMLPHTYYLLVVVAYSFLFSKSVIQKQIQRKMTVCSCN